MNESQLFENVLTQNLAALTMALIFIWYLVRKDKMNSERDRETKLTYEAFNRTIQNHLQHQLKVELQITKSLNGLTGCINTLSHKQDNRQRTVDRRHESEKE